MTSSEPSESPTPAAEAATDPASEPANEPAPDSPAGNAPAAPSPRRTAALLALAVVAVIGPFVKEYNAQTAARYTLTAAIYDDGTLRLDDYEHALGYDKAIVDGHVYSDKAPGQPIAAVPVYAVARAVGAEPATHLRVHDNLGVWWVTFWSSVLPGAALAALLYFHARRFFPDTAAFAALGVMFSTLLLPMTADLHAHVLVCALAFGAWHLALFHDRDLPRMALAGALLGAAMATEYPSVLVALIIGVFLLVRRRVADAAVMTLAALPFLALVAWYQWAAFGDPFTTSYAQKFADPNSAQVEATRLPNPEFVAQIFGGSKGLIFTPIVLVGLWWALKLVTRERGPIRDDVAVGLVVFLAYLLLQASWPNPWGGEMPGPRYLITALPFLVTPVAAAWRRIWMAPWVAIGAVSMGLALFTQSLLASDAWLIRGHLQNFDETGANPTVFDLAVGPVGWAIYAGLAGGALYVAITTARDERRYWRPAAAPTTRTAR